MPYRDMAVLYRAHYVTRAVEGVLLREKIPYTIYSGVPFFSRMEIKDALSYLRMLAYRTICPFGASSTRPSATWASGGWLFWRNTRRSRAALYTAPCRSAWTSPV